MGQKEVDELRKLIQRRATVLQKLKTAKGKTKVTLEAELTVLKRRISVLDEHQH